jgi:hypothetical protein
MKRFTRSYTTVNQPILGNDYQIGRILGEAVGGVIEALQAFFWA